jgi:hypothetical protein
VFFSNLWLMAMEANLSFWLWVKYSTIIQRDTKEGILLYENPVLFVTFSDHRSHCVSESFSIDKPQKGWFKSFNGGGARGRVKEGELSESFSWLNVSFDGAIDLNW